MLAVLGISVGVSRADCLPMPPGLLGAWPGENTATDLLGIHNGALQGAVSFASGEVGQAFVFNGTNTYVQVPDAPEFSPHVGPLGELTLEAWVFMPRLPKWDTATGQPYRAVAVKGSPGVWEYGLFISTNAVPYFGSWQANGNGYAGASGVAISTNQWHHLAGVLRKGQFARLYVDGQLVAETTSFSGDTSDGTSPLYIGRRGDGQYLDGMVDEVTLFGRALSGTEVNAIFNAGASGKCGSVPGAAVPYFTDFQSGTGAGWMLPIADDSESLGFTRFNGRFGNGSQTLTVTNLVPGQVYSLGFDFYAIDSWDGGSSDYFNIAINGVQVFHQTFGSAASQSYPGVPDEGRANFGFNPSYTDAVYRNMEVTFTASNAVTLLTFDGQNLEAIDNESWGIDNVSVQLTSTLTNTFVRSTTLPPAGTTNSVAIENFTISANWPLPVSATNAANFILRDAGADGLLGSGDDRIYSLTPSLPGGGGRSVAFAIANPPLQPGLYRFQTTAGLVGTNGLPLPAFATDFTIANPVLGSIESTSNDTFDKATPLPLAESPAGSGFFTAYGFGTFSTTSDVDYWSFNAEAGDVLSVRVEAESLNVYPQLYIRNSSDGNVSTVGGDYGGVAAIQNLTISTPGTYYLRVWSTHARSLYALRMDLTRNGPQLESENNDSQANANQINMNFSPGLEQGRMAAAVPAADTAGDFYRLGMFNPGNAITATVLLPGGSTLDPSQTILSVQVAGNSTPLMMVTNSPLNFNVTSNGVHYVRVETQNRTLRAQYLLTINVADTIPPQVTDVSLPAEGSLSTAIIERFTLSFSEDMLSTTVSNTANCELRSAGPNGVIGDADDVLYHVAPSAAYAVGLSESYAILDGPLQPGLYRFTIGTALQDRAYNHMAAPFVRNFSVANLPGYVTENRNNDVLALATPLTPSTGTNGNGTVAWLNNTGTPAQPHSIAAGQFNADTNLDIVTANYSGDNITVLTNNGGGAFATAATVSTGNGPVAAAVGDINGDSKLDLAVANYAGNTVSVVIGDGNGGFLLTSNLSSFSTPYDLALADLNNDGKADLIVPNYGNSTLAVLLGNGNGTFQTRSNYSVGSNPEAVAVGDLNGDGKPDLAVANYGSATVSVLTNTGIGTFVLAAHVPCGPNPRSIVLGDVTGDGLLDLVTVNNGDRSVSVMAGNGNGTFQARKFYYGGFTDPYHLALADLNGDGSLDVAVPGYGNNTFALFLNNGTGVFTNLYSYGAGGNPIGVAAGDFTGDGRQDLAFCHYNGNYVSLWAANALSTPAEDPPGSGLRTFFGRGTRSNYDDLDFWQFPANAGDQVIVAVDTVGNPGSSQLYFQIQGSDGGVYTSWYPNGNGWGQSGVVTLPQSGTYFVRVSRNYDYQGEYRIRVTLARPPIQISSEGNTSLGAARAVALTLTPTNHLVGTIAGYLGVGDGTDYYSLGNLLGGATISLNVREPSSSQLAGVLSIYNAAGTLLTNSLPGVTNFVFTVPPGSNGVYYVAISASQASYAGSATTAIGFNGSQSYVDLGAWNAGTQWTLQAWVNPSSLPGGRHTIVGGVAQSLDWSINLYDGQFSIDLGSASYYRSGEPVTPGQWYHVTGTYDGTNALLYINGQLKVATTYPSFTGTAQGVRVGSEVCCSGNTFPGLIKDVRIWNRPLSISEIATSLNTPLNGDEPNLLGYWRFNEGSGPTTADLSSFARTGTLASGAYWVNLGPTNAMQPSLPAQYLLGFDLASPAPPAITGVSLPENSTTNSGIITSFSVSFNEDLDPRFTWLVRSIYRFSGLSYFLSDASGDWPSTEAAAVAAGGHLAAINSAAENNFLRDTFSSSAAVWMGLNHLAGGAWSWSSGDPVSYQNWVGGQPDNGGGSEFAARMRTDGAWEDTSYSTSLRGIIEVTNTADADADGLVTGLDPYPSDPINAFDLRAAGTDGSFETSDDIVYRVYSTGYSSGLSSGFAIADGPLQPGNYRFKVTTALRDRFGNTMPSEFTQFFAIAPVPGFIEAARRTNGVSSTSLSLNPSNRMDGSFAYASSYGTPSNPHFLTQAYLNGDTNLDLVSANLSADNITVWLGNADGTFQATTNIATGNGPISVAVADFNSDTNSDLAVANYYAHTLTILLGDGNGNFQVRTNLTGFSSPCNLAAMDFNRDGKVDLVVPNYGNSTLAVLFGNGDGTFQSKTNYSVGTNPETVAVGDLNGDAQPDLVVANAGSSFVSVLLGNTNGMFQAAVNYPNIGGNRYASLGDVNGDGRLDIVAISGSTLSVFFGKGDGTFQPRTDYSMGGSDPYQVILTDINADGALDAVVAGYGGNRLYTILNNGDGTFGGQFTYNPGGNPISVTAGDYNHDGRMDLAMAGYSGNYIQVLLGNNTEGLVLDPAGTGLRGVAARGNLADGSDLDYWTFSAQAGDNCVIATENPGNPSASQLLFRIYYPDGSQWTYFYPDYYGRGQLSLGIPASGTYTIRVEQQSYGYAGEYRFRLTLARPPMQLESENNDSIANADPLTYAIVKGTQSATVMGYIGNYDTSGDYFQLGNLASDTKINLGFRRPASSGLLEGLVLYNAAGTIVTNSAVGDTNLVYIIPPGADGLYYAQIFDAGPASAPTFGGVNGSALWFNGGYWVSFTNAIIPTAGDFTVEAWAYSYGADSYRDILSQGSGGNAFYMGYRSWMARAGDGWEYISSLTWPQNAWHHFAVVKSSTNTLYFIDGVLAASKGSAIPNPAASTPFRIGRQYGGNGEYWYGDIDEVRIWNTARAGTDIAANMTNRLTGAESGLVGYWRFDEGSGLVLNDATTNGNTGVFQGNAFWAPSARTGQPSSILSQYLLDIRMASANPPTITSLSLPAEGSTNSGVWDRFSLTFSQDMNAGTVNTSTNYELRCAGPDNVFGTPDDQFYTVVNSPAYVSGTSSSYLITDGPLQPGLFRFTGTTNLADKTLNPMATNYVRSFAISNVPGFFFETRSNDSFAAAITLSFAPTNRPDGSFSGGPGLSLASSPERLVAGQLNGDSNMDLVVCRWSYPGVSVLTGNGDGSFTVKTNYTVGTGDGAWSLALGNFNGDTNLDLAVAHHNNNTITILTGNGDGTFQVRTNYAVGSIPYHVVTGDFNNDGKTDLAVPNHTGNTPGSVSILLGNGDGTFLPAVNYATGSGPVYAAVGDVNGDGKQDLMVANYYSDNVSLFLGNGNGTFAAPVTLAAGHYPRVVVLRDLNGDGKLDLAVFNGGDNTISVLMGNGDGSFQPRVNYGAGTSDGYEMLATDMNGDGWPDLVVGGYNNNVITVFPNHGDGTFDAATGYPMGAHIVGLAAADFNNDGRMDIAAASDNGNALWTLLGNNTEPVAADGVLRTTAGRGNLNSGDVDYWSFSGQAGDTMNLATQNPGDPGASQLLFRIYYPSGSQWTSFYPDYYGRGQMGATLPVSGTYYIRVEQNYGYVGEYRFRLTLAKPPVQVESEANDSTSQANSLTFTNTAGHRLATVLGYIGSADGNGDYYRLGSLSAGAAIKLGCWQPPSSGFANVLEVYNSAGTLVANSIFGATNLNYTVPVSGDGPYYARIRLASAVLPPAPLHPTGSTNSLLYTPNSYSEAMLAVPASAMTVSFWFRTMDPNTALFSVSDGGGGHDRHLYLNSGGNINARLWSNQVISSSGLTLADGNWHYVVYTYGSAIAGQKIYVDGVLVASGNKTSSDFTSNNRVRFGYSQDAPNAYMTGYLDEARIWNYTFTSAEVLNNMTNSLTGSETGLIGYWRFNEGTGLVSVDRTTNAHNATLIGSATWAPAVNTGVSVSAGLFAQYLLSLDVSDSVAPAITSITLPSSGTTNLGIFDRFTINFSKDLDPEINNLNRYIRSYNNHGYVLTDSGSTWYLAEQQARAWGGHLVALNDSLENAFVYAAFGSSVNFWIGLSDEAQHGTYVWSSGEPYAYTNWDSGQPNNANNQDYAAMQSGGFWADYPASANYRGLVEVAGLDSDGDGIPNTLDPYPYDALNGVDLRAAGLDGVFDTADDLVYRTTHDTYSSGTTLAFYLADGPLQPGNYRFTVTGSVRDVAGNGAAPFVQYFTIAGVPGYVNAGRTNNSSVAATPLPFTEDPAGLKSVGARGKLFDGNDQDWWSFSGTNGDWFRLATEVPGNPGGVQLHYQVYAPNGSRVLDFYPDYYGVGQSTPLTLTTNGTFLVQVTPNYGYYGEYRLRLSTVTPPKQFELEDNGSLAAATPLTLVSNGTAQSVSVAGYVRTAGDLDYYNLGTVSNGSSIFLNVRQPSSSPLVPIVSVYNADNAYQSEAPGGRPDDGIAEVRVTQTGTYYALVRGSLGSGGLDAQYLLDVQVLPTGTVLFPNLAVSSIALPTAPGLQSGQPMTYSFTVANTGSTNTIIANWLDRAVLSTDAVLGNADDIPLGFFPHAGVLNPGDSYSVSNQFALPDGLSGDFYIIAQTDAGNAVNEFIFEGDNTTVSSTTFHVNLAPYADLRVENLAVAGPDVNNVYTMTWNTANRGTGPSPAGFYERFSVRNVTSGALVANLDQPIGSTLAPNGTVPHTQTVVATSAGNYLVTVTTESHNDVWEFDGISHATAEANNAATANFAITAYYTVALSSSPAGAGNLVGAGTYGSGAPVTVSATPNTNVLPYLFVNWTEGGAFQSAGTNYSFTIAGNRSLVANFTLPSFQIAASNNPSVGGTVSGQGAYFYGTTNVLIANANFGYKFTNWTENGSVIANTPLLTNIVTSNRFVVANYVEANTLHVVSTATSPTNIAVVAGAGSYTNGQTVSISAPPSITNPPSIYNFREFRLNGALVGNSASFNKTFSTLDPTNMQFVAIYDTVSILPLIVKVSANQAQPVPAMTNFVLTFQFNRTMDTGFIPVVLLTNATAPVQVVVPPGGAWSMTALANDTFSTPFISLSTGMDGTNLVFVSGARDLGGGQLALTNVLQLVVDVTPPPNPVISIVNSNNTWATISWAGFPAPPDIAAFRLYLATNSFSTVAGMSPVSTLGSGWTSYTYYGLTLDRPYFAAVAAVDLAGNSSPLVTTLAFVLPSAVPPPVTVAVAAPAASSAMVSWNTYDTTYLLGFAGFQLYHEISNFTSVASLTPKQTLGAGVRSVQVNGLDRTKTNYFAVVGFNGNNAFNSAVTTVPWRDPYAGVISASLTLGGGGQTNVDILQTITVGNNAVVTIPAGTVLRFAPGTGFNVQQGAVTANGTPLDPIVFTSANDRTGLVPAAGDWSGINLGSGSGASLLRHVFVKYGAGLTVSNAAPTVDAFTAFYNLPAGLTLQGTAALTTSNALLVLNGIGAQQFNAAQLTVLNSVLKNNGTNALAAAANGLVATQVWWGSASPAVVAAGVQGPVNTSGFLGSEPLLTPAIGTVGNVTQVGSQAVDLRLACRTADSMRLSEDSTFFATFFGPVTNLTTFPLSAGGGLKTIFAQYRSLTGQTSSPVSVSVNYITAGPTISAFNLSEGQVLTRPLSVTGSAHAPLGMAAMEFYIDGIGQGTNSGGSYAQWLVVSGFDPGIHRVKLLARDNYGNFATLERNVTMVPTPPPAPMITVPVSDLSVASNSIAISGTAEPFIEIRLFRSGTASGVTNASAAGTFSFPAIALSEGVNLFSAMAIDSLGSANSAVRSVTRDTVPPAKLVMDTPVYHPGSGLALTWKFPTTGKLATTFRVFWHTAPFTDVAQATGSTVPLSTMNYSAQGLATGNYWFTVVGYDTVGNASPMADLVTAFYDPLPPAFNVTFDKASPVGVGPVHVVFSASKPLSGMPTVTVQPSGMPPVLFTVSNSALNTYEGVINVNTFLPSGLARFNIAAQDTLGNPFNGAPVGPAFVIDVTPPDGVVGTAPLGPVQTTNNVNVAVSLQLTEAAKSGTTPALTFAPPLGAPVPITMSGAGSTWNGALTLTPAMGSGIGHFIMTVSDALDNLGHNITAGSALEIYNTALPTPPGQPVHLTATAQAGGRIRLSWDPVANAEIYRVYSDPGTNQYETPVDLIADNISTNGYLDLPSADGYYMYAVTALRRGAEGTNSITRVALSDRTPPSAPTNVTVGLIASGLQITWQAGPGAAPASYNVYRNGTLIRTVNAVTPVVDNPPRGIMSYTVGAADSLGNEALSAPSTFELLVGAVGNLQALVEIGAAPVLTWTSSDPTAVGFNLYRNGIKQNGAPLASPSFTDSLPLGTELVTYSVRAVNATNAESASRSVAVYPTDLALLLNAQGTGTGSAPITRYFDDYQITVSNRAGSGSLPLRQLEVHRSMAGASPLDMVSTVNGLVDAGSGLTRNLVVPSATVTSDQSVRLRAVQETDVGGSAVIYQRAFSFGSVQTPSTMIEVSANQVPLAGGLTPFDVKVYNRGSVPMYFITTRNGGADPGELYIAVKNQQGQEMARTTYKGAPLGVIFVGGSGYVMLPAGSSLRLTVPDVLVPEALASNLVTFEAVVSTIYDRPTTTGQQTSGPLSGSMQSSLTQTPYYGSAQTDQPLYSDDTPVVITGQALDRVTGLPKPNVPLKLGFATRGYSWTRDVTTDGGGNYSYTYAPTPGFAGSLRIWAAHPDIYDQLNQVQITIYRLYVSPNLGDIRMSKNDTLRFSLSLFNPGDTNLTGFTLEFDAYQMVGTNQVPITSLHGAMDLDPNFTLAAGARRDVPMRLIADADAPTNAVAVCRIVSAEGASATFTGYATLLEPVPIVAVAQPAIGYVEVSVNRGDLVSREVTIINRGLKDLQGVTMTQPTNTWMVVNLSAQTNGLIALPDLPVGGSNTFSVVFAPPTNSVMDFFQDALTIRGTNAQAAFNVRLYARVTSASRGAVQFHVDNILGLDVPNASVRLRNTLLQTETPAALTDLNGLVTITNLQEGDWSWQATAPGHSANVGVASIAADQIIQIDTRLSKSVVTINFSVVPVPYTDRYEIRLEQTFETHVPAPVLVLDPIYQEFQNVKPGFQASFIVTAKNAGLIQMTDLTFTGQRTGSASFTPLIEYVPVLLPQQTVEIPFAVAYWGTNTPGQQGSPLIDCWPSPFKILGLIGPFLDGMAAFARAYAMCARDLALIAVSASVAVTMVAVLAAAIAALPLPYKIASYLGCLLATLLGGGGGGDLGGGSGPPTGRGGFDWGGPGCFTAETRVLLADGRFKTLDQMKAGDVVRSGPRPGDISMVTEMLRRDSDHVREIAFAAPYDGLTDTVRASDEHLFWVDGQGWVEARKLRVGDWLFHQQAGRVQVTASERVSGKLPVFTFRLRGDNAFYANGVLVHDLCGWWTPPPVASPDPPPPGEPASPQPATSNAE